MVKNVALAILLAFLNIGQLSAANAESSCFREACDLLIQINIDENMLRAFYKQKMILSSPVEWGRAIKGIKWEFDAHPVGRIYGENYAVTSSKFPGPPTPAAYAIFVTNEIAIAGANSDHRVSRYKLSISLEHARLLNAAAREVGPQNTWVTVK